MLPSVAFRKGLRASPENINLSTLLRDLGEGTNRIELNENLLPQPRIQLPCSAFVTASTEFDLQERQSYGENRATALVKRMLLEGLQNIVADGDFSQSGIARLDSATMEPIIHEDIKTKIYVYLFIEI